MITFRKLSRKLSNLLCTVFVSLSLQHRNTHWTSFKIFKRFSPPSCLFCYIFFSSKLSLFLSTHYLEITLSNLFHNWFLFTLSHVILCSWSKQIDVSLFPLVVYLFNSELPITYLRIKIFFYGILSYWFLFKINAFLVSANWLRTSLSVCLLRCRPVQVIYCFIIFSVFVILRSW